MTAERLREYRHGSYRLLFDRKPRPAFLRVTDFLAQAGGLADTPAGWAAYQSYLAWQAAEGPAGRNAAYARLSAGWALGSADFKKGLVAEHLRDATHHAWARSDAREEREIRWQVALDAALKTLGCRLADAESAKKSAPWKVAIASHLMQTTAVPNAWLAEALRMGSDVYVSKHVGLARAADHPAQKLTAQLKGKHSGMTPSTPSRRRNSLLN